MYVTCERGRECVDNVNTGGL